MDKNFDAVKRSKKAIFFNNLIGGIAWGVGATVGAALILAIAGIILSKVDTVPVIGDYVENVLKYVAANQEEAVERIDPPNQGSPD